MTGRKTAITVVVGAVVALTPPILVYLQGRAELRERYRHTEAEADAGYQALVESVRELRATVSAQSETIARLQGHVEAIEASSSTRMTGRLPPITRPTFTELPANLDAAQMKK
jgi:hypothetical protein